MKKWSILILAVFINPATFAQKPADAISQAQKLISQKKYESAFKILDTADPDNKNEDVVLLKEDIALNYFVSSLMHQMFALKDLEKDETIAELRGSNGEFSMHSFKINEVLDSLIVKNPGNCKLYQGLGTFYYEVHLKYGEEWLLPNDELYKQIKTNFQKAIDGNCANDVSYYAIGFLNLIDEKYKETIPYFLKSIELNKKDGDSFYNLAYAYLYTDNLDSALIYAKESLELYTDSSYKADAARMMGQICYEKKEDAKAIENYLVADRYEPENYYTMKAMLNLYVKTGNAKETELRASFFNLNPENPTIYNDLNDIYFDHKKEADLVNFYKAQLSNKENSKKVNGSLNFYLGQTLLDTDNKQAKEYFLKSKEIFAQIFEPDHQVFKAIEKGIKSAEETK